jgi:uncharacterized SAM-binding protein YcdF (DUF218 family)
MFFILSKLFWFVAAPTNALLILAGLGLLAAFMRWSRTALWLMGMATAGLILIAATPLPRAAVRPLEDRFAQNLDVTHPITGIIVLGGAISSSRGQIRFSDAASRMTMAVALAQKHPDAKLVFAGGSAQLVGTARRTEADDASQFFGEMGINPARVILENRSRNTYENATETAKLISTKPGERWVLVTSAYHMARSMGVFRKAGLSVEAWPVDYHSQGNWKDFVRPVHRWSWNFTLADDVAKEWIGLIAYYNAGYTDEILPKP